jgi:hypothetical protein
MSDVDRMLNENADTIARLKADVGTLRRAGFSLTAITGWVSTGLHENGEELWHVMAVYDPPVEEENGWPGLRAYLRSWARGRLLTFIARNARSVERRPRSC